MEMSYYRAFREYLGRHQDTYMHWDKMAYLNAWTRLSKRKL